MLAGVRKLLSPGRLGVAGLVLAAVVAGVLLLVPASGTYIFLPNEPHAVGPLVTVEGERRRSDGGGIYYLDVIVRRPSLLERLFPGVREGSSLVPEEAVNPTGVSDTARREGSRREMTRSQSVAAAVALRELGYKVIARPVGALISDVVPDAPAAGKLQPTDIVVAVDGAKVLTPGDLRRLLRRVEPGQAVTLTVRRGTTTLRVKLETIADPREPGRPVIGVIPDQAADIRLPIEVEIDTGDVGGPSAGLAFALDVLEELGRDVDRGYKVAVTGAIELDGSVVPVGGVRQKTIGARGGDIDVFLVPAGGNAEEAKRNAGSDLRVIPVQNFRQALQELATLPERPAD